MVNGYRAVLRSLSGSDISMGWLPGVFDRRANFFDPYRDLCSLLFIHRFGVEREVGLGEFEGCGGAGDDFSVET